MRALLSSLLLSIPGIVFATAQIPDIIILGDKQEALFSEPFVEYLRLNPHEILKLEPFITEQCSASWRGFQAQWEIRDDKLFLVSLHANPCDDNSTSIPISTFFENATGPVHAEWYSGRLVVPQGKIVEYVHMGYESKYESYLVITVLHGNILDRQPVDDIAGSDQAR